MTETKRRTNRKEKNTIDKEEVYKEEAHKEEAHKEEAHKEEAHKEECDSELIEDKKEFTENIPLTNNEKLKQVIIEVKKSKDGVIILDDGRTYTKVAQRIKKFREAFGFDVKIVSVMKEVTRDFAHAEAQVWVKAEDNSWDLIQTANAYEEKHTSFINQQSYVEVAETSAVGRCLAFLGIFGDEFASVDEMVNVQNKDNAKQSKSNVKRASQAKKSRKKGVTEEQLKIINDFMKENKAFTVEMVLDGQKDISGKKATKFEDLTFEGGEQIIGVIRQSSEEPI